MVNCETRKHVATEHGNAGSLFAAVVLVLILTSIAAAHDNVVTHPGLTQAAVNLADIPEVTEYGYFDIGTDPECSFVDEGSVKEDLGLTSSDSWDTSVWGTNACGLAGLNWINHAYNPITGDGWWDLGGIDALAYCVPIWQQALWDYWSGYEAEAYFGVGRVCHLLEDMTSIAHVHGDVHIPGLDPDDFEKWGESNFVSYTFTATGTVILPDGNEIDLEPFIPAGTVVLPDGTEVDGNSIEGIIHSMALFAYELSSFHGGVFTWGEDPPDSELKRMSGNTLHWDWLNLGWYIEDVGYYHPDPPLSILSTWWDCTGDAGRYYLENIADFTPAVFEKSGVYEANPNTKPLLQIYGDVLYPKCVEYCAGLYDAFVSAYPITLSFIDVQNTTAPPGGTIGPATIEVSNNTSSYYEFKIHRYCIDPSGTTHLLGRSTIGIGGGETKARSRSFRIPPGAGEGEYEFGVICTDIDDNEIGGDSFSFTVAGIVSPESLGYDSSSGTKKVQDWHYIAVGE